MIGQLLSYYCIFRATFIALRTKAGGGVEKCEEFISICIMKKYFGVAVFLSLKINLNNKLEEAVLYFCVSLASFQTYFTYSYTTATRWHPFTSCIYLRTLYIPGNWSVLRALHNSGVQHNHWTEKCCFQLNRCTGEEEKTPTAHKLWDFNFHPFILQQAITWSVTRPDLFQLVSNHHILNHINHTVAKQKITCHYRIQLNTCFLHMWLQVTL